MRGYERVVSVNADAKKYECAADSPHIRTADDLDDRAHHLLPVQVNPLQQRLQPAHVALHVRVQERENLAFEQTEEAS